jgi:hypothetical protein
MKTDIVLFSVGPEMSLRQVYKVKTGDWSIGIEETMRKDYEETLSKFPAGELLFALPKQQFIQYYGLIPLSGFTHCEFVAKA